MFYKNFIFLRTIKFENTGIDPKMAIEKFKNSDYYYISIHSWMRPNNVSVVPPIYFGISNITKNNIISGDYN